MTRTGQTPDQVYKITIESDARSVWDAITNPEFARQYWFGYANISKDWKTGSAWQHTGDDGHVFHTGEVIESEPPSRLVLTWHDPGDDVDVSRVTFLITPVGIGVELTVIHGDFIDGSVMATHVCNGWPAVIANMKVFLEGSGEILQNAPCECA